MNTRSCSKCLAVAHGPMQPSNCLSFPNPTTPHSGVYKGLHLSSTASPSPAAPAPPTSTPTPALLHPSSTSSAAATSNNNGTAHPVNATPAAATQVLLGNNNNNSLRLGVAAAKRVHAPRTLSTTVSTSALKLAHAATANCQKPKVTTASASPLDMVPR